MNVRTDDPQIKALRRLQAAQTDASKKLEIELMIQRRIEELTKAKS